MVWLRKIGCWWALSCLLLITSACTPTPVTDQAVFSVLSDPKTFNAVLSAESPNIFGLTYEGLITENPLTGQKEPALAKAWQISADNKTITFQLREGLQWSDGQPLTVEDVLFSYNDLYLNPKIPNNYRDSLRIGQKGDFPLISSPRPGEIEFRISEPFAPFLDSAEVPILPAHILRQTVESVDEQGNLKFLTTWGTDTPPQDIVVNGPYRVKEYITSQRIVFERNPYFWKRNAQGQRLPAISRVIWAIVESTDTALLQFRSGSLDAISVTPEYFSLLKKEEERGNFTLYNGGPAYGSTFLFFNLNQGQRNGQPLVDPIKSRWFNDENFRQAIAYGIDRQRMINNIFRGLGAAQNALISMQSPYYNRSLAGYNYDPQRARALLQAAGFTYDAQGQLLDADNHPVRFVLHTNAGNKIREAMGAQIQEDLGKLGIQVDFSPMSFSVLVDKLSNSLTWDAVLLGLTGGNDPHIPNVWYTDGNLHMFNQKPQPGSAPIDGWVIAPWEQKLADLALKGSQVLDFDQRRAIYAEQQQVALTYLPFIYLVNPYSLAAVRNRFCSIQYSALGGAFWNLDEITLCPALGEISRRNYH
ncbi:ABC transporter substrate-binding protein [Synechocystis sp. LKSZ1]|uniref:ABC transporter substrate-binding protein n=1 Tax=Synechocystis sp. LKSZ1 TaxID=3144951 RepID=UPI00336BED0D